MPKTVSMTIEFERFITIKLTVKVDLDTYWRIGEKAAASNSDEPWLNLFSRLLEIPEIRYGRIIPTPEGW